MRHVGSYEAKTHFPKLLESASKGETIVITKRGRPMALLMPVNAKTRDPKAAVEAMQRFSRGKTLGGGSLKELIEEGRR